MFFVCDSSDDMKMSGEVTGSVLAEKCSPTHASAKPSSSARTILSAFSFNTSASGLDAGWSGM
jgi:hypothetical protein